MSNEKKLIVKIEDKDGKPEVVRIIGIHYTDPWFLVGRIVKLVEEIEEQNDRMQWRG